MCLSVCLSICLSACPPIYLSVCLSLSAVDVTIYALFRGMMQICCTSGVFRVAHGFCYKKTVDKKSGAFFLGKILGVMALPMEKRRIRV